MDDLCSCSNLKDVLHIKTNIKNNVKDKFKQLVSDKIDKIDENSKLYLYKKLNPSLEGGFYLTESIFAIRNIFTKLRIIVTITSKMREAGFIKYHEMKEYVKSVILLMTKLILF